MSSTFSKASGAIVKSFTILFFALVVSVILVSCSSGDKDNAIPSKIGNDKWIKISAGAGAHTCGIKADNMLYYWGRNDYADLTD